MQNSLLDILIDRVAHSRASMGAFFDNREVKSWGKGEFDVLLRLGLLKQAQNPKDYVLCNGCEEGCFRDVEMIPRDGDVEARFLIVCDQRDDMGYIPVDAEDLKQWYSSIECFAAALPALLKTVMPPDDPKSENGKWPLGLIKSKNEHVPITLTVSQGDDLVLLIGDKSISLKQVLTFNKNVLIANDALISNMTDTSTQKETPEARRERLQNQINTYKAQGKRNFFAQTAKDEDITPQRLRAIIDAKNEDATLDSVWQNVASNKK